MKALKSLQPVRNKRGYHHRGRRPMDRGSYPTVVGWAGSRGWLEFAGLPARAVVVVLVDVQHDGYRAGRGNRTENVR